MGRFKGGVLPGRRSPQNGRPLRKGDTHTTLLHELPRLAGRFRVNNRLQIALQAVDFRVQVNRRARVTIDQGAQVVEALLSLREELQIDVSVATFNHGLRGDAGASDVRFVEDIARQWGVEVVSGAADVLAIKDEAGLNLEEAARQARYTFLMQTAVQIGADRIAIAHNQDDQAETVLMHIIRGTGMRGLRGMLPITPLSEYHLLDDWAVTADDGGKFDDVDPSEVILIRPLLDVSRAEIRAYADVLLHVLERWVPITASACREHIVGGTRLSATGLKVVRRLIKGERVSQADSGLQPREWRELAALLGIDPA